MTALGTSISARPASDESTNAPTWAGVSRSRAMSKPPNGAECPEISSPPTSAPPSEPTSRPSSSCASSTESAPLRAWKRGSLNSEVNGNAWAGAAEGLDTCRISVARAGYLRALALLERGHREARVVQLLPVELRRLLGPRPDDRLARVVDLVRDPVAVVDADPRDHPGQGVGHAVEGVVVVVEHDHAPGVAQAAAGLAHARELDRPALAHAASRSAFLRQ